MLPQPTTILKRKKILITGATGFIGTHLVRRLANLGAEVLALSRTQSKMPGKVDGVKFRRASLLDFDELSCSIEKFKPQKIVHLASLVNLERSYRVAQKCIRVNIEGTLHLLEALRKIPFDIFTYVSTTEIYGTGKIPFQEEQKECPPSPYAVTKLSGEQFCQLYGKAFGYPVCILRLSSCYGPGQAPERLIPSIILSCLKAKPIRINSGNQKRDFLYVEDAVEGILQSLVRKTAVGQLINIGARKSYRFVDIAKKIKKLTGSNSAIILRQVPDRPAEASHWKCDSTKAEKLLGWKERCPLEDGLLKTISWFGSHLNAYKN